MKKFSKIGILLLLLIGIQASSALAESSPYVCKCDGYDIGNFKSSCSACQTRCDAHPADDKRLFSCSTGSWSGHCQLTRYGSFCKCNASNEGKEVYSTTECEILCGDSKIAYLGTSCQWR